MTHYTEDDLRSALRDEATAAPLIVDTWAGLRRRMKRRRRAQAGVALVGALSVLAVLIGVNASSQHLHPQSLLPASYEQACAAEPDVCPADSRGKIPSDLYPPLQLPRIPTSRRCPVTPGKDATNGYVFGLQFGRGSVHMVLGNRGDPAQGTSVLGTTQQPGWFAFENVWLVDPTYNGPFTVRGTRIDGAGTVAFGGSPELGAYVEPPGPDPNTHDGYRTPPGTIWVSTPGCYGFQINGDGFTETVIIRATAPQHA